MANKLRVGDVTIDSNMQYNGKEVIRLCNVSFENGVRRFKLTQAADGEQALRAAYDHGYQGRAKDNNLPWKARASKCFNLRAITKQMPNPSIGLIVESLLTKGFFCTPAIGIDGSIRLGESFLCPKVTSIYEPEEVIIQKIKDFECHQCDEINNQLPEIYHQFL